MAGSQNGSTASYAVGPFRALAGPMLALAVVCVINVGFSLLARQQFDRNPELKPYFQHMLDDSRAQIVFLGNSIVERGVDDRQFSHETGLTATQLTSGGAATAFWYLTIKNVLLSQKEPPRLVVVFFRDNMLTMPEFRTEGRYKERLVELSTGTEPLLDQLAYFQQMGFLKESLTRYVSLYHLRGAIKSDFEYGVRDRLARMALSVDQTTLRNAIANVFDEGNMIPELVTQAQIMMEMPTDMRYYDFESQIDRSFLPVMIDLAASAGIRLTFVRTKKRRDLTSGQQPEPLLRYMADLRSYFDDKGITLYDYTDDPRIKLEHFALGDHLNEETGRPLFTSLLAKTLEPEIRAISK